MPSAGLTPPPPPQWESKRLKVTFKNGLPVGIRAEFEYEKEAWIALPRSKYRRILSVLDRLIGIYSVIITDSLGIINDHPEDAARVAKILEKASAAQKLWYEISGEKTRAVIMTKSDDDSDEAQTQVMP